MGSADPLLLKKLFLSQRRLGEDLAFTRCLVDRVKSFIAESGDNLVPRDNITSYVRECHRIAYGREIGKREEPKFYGDLDRLRVLLGVSLKHGEITPEFRVTRPEAFKLNPVFFEWRGDSRTLAESYVRYNLVARTILDNVIAKYDVATLGLEDFRRAALNALEKLSSNDTLPANWRKHLATLKQRLSGDKGAKLLLDSFINPLSLLSNNTLILYEDGKIIVSEELRRLLRPETAATAGGGEVKPVPAPPRLLDAILEAYIEAVHELIGISTVPRESGIPIDLQSFIEKLAARLGTSDNEAYKHLLSAARMCPQGIIVESFDVLHVKREPQVYIIPTLLEICKSR